MEGVMAQAGPHVRLRKGSSIPEELGFLDPELLRRPHRVVCKGGGACRHSRDARSSRSSAS